MGSGLAVVPLGELGVVLLVAATAESGLEVRRHGALDCLGHDVCCAISLFGLVEKGPSEEKIRKRKNESEILFFALEMFVCKGQKSEDWMMGGGRIVQVVGSSGVIMGDGGEALLKLSARSQRRKFASFLFGGLESAG